MNHLQRADAVLARAQAKPVKESPVAVTPPWSKAAERANARDPWRHALAGVENMPDAPGRVERFSDEIRVASGFLWNDVLGFEMKMADKRRLSRRLGRLMRWLGWDGPKPLRMGEKILKGYAKTRRDLSNRVASSASVANRQYSHSSYK